MFPTNDEVVCFFSYLKAKAFIILKKLSFSKLLIFLFHLSGYIFPSGSSYFHQLRFYSLCAIYITFIYSYIFSYVHTYFFISQSFSLAFCNSFSNLSTLFNLLVLISPLVLLILLQTVLLFVGFLILFFYLYQLVFHLILYRVHVSFVN